MSGCIAGLKPDRRDRPAARKCRCLRERGHDPGARREPIPI